ncbi:TatA/E family protein of Tat protein translocase [Palleronia aestuarii]|uniref:Sec-independent protein translocase protein TatA n=1 Tax=Palleronia aestuarii TaxID=568105 RepID=A0A2W7ND46_9RHOB|nr:twin-arginine translocase TatA/TatE family subunit [Palleronia aestuarii]PZX18311.1 TatA/E family protein of Tat protein translocase [Palleronia aestuarii]
MLNNIGLPGLLLIAVVVLVLFGRGKISSLMGEVGKGITAFKKGVGEGSEEERQKDATPREIAASNDEVVHTGAATERATTGERVTSDGSVETEKRNG